MKPISAAAAGLLCLTACLWHLPPSAGDSLWNRAGSRRVHLFDDVQARRVGDLLTLVISESTCVGATEDTRLKKSSDAAGKFDFESASGGGFAEQAATASLDMSGSSNRGFAGNASYNDSRQFTDQINVTVVDVLPNGNLVVSGQRCLKIAGEQRTLVVSGVVRPMDIGPANRVSSRQLADFRAYYEGEGASKKFTRQGWLSRAVNRVWPF